MKKILYAVFLGYFAVLWGCATSQDLDRARRELDYKITAADEKAAAQNALIRQELAKVHGDVSTFRKNQAEAGADLTDTRGSIQQLRGITDSLRKDITAAQARVVHGEGDVKGLKEKLDGLLFKIGFIEDFLGIGKKDEPEGGKQPDASSGKENGNRTNKEAVYAAAYELFKDGKYDKARSEFQNFLQQFPDTEYSDNAQFWIAECYYFEKKYENAILEYEKVVSNYAGGDKVPHALLKEGFSFLNLGDKASAKLVLQRVIKDYPNTNQARTARAKLLSIK